MNERIKSLREQRARLGQELRAILDTAEKEKRELSADENKKYNELFSKQESLKAQIQNEERQVELDRELAAAVPPAPAPAAVGGGTPEELQLTGFRAWLRDPQSAQITKELRDLQAGTLTAGGALIPPQQFVNQLIQAVDDMVFVRRYATTMRLTSAASLGAPSLDADPSDAEWTTELATGSNDTAMAFGKRELTPKPFAKRIKMSKKLLQMAPNVDALVRQRLAYKFAITEEKGYLTGAGATGPLGVFVASDNGIPTGRDVSSGNTTTAIQFDGLIAAKYALKGSYHPGARWLFHRNAVEQISKLKDGDGQYLWRQSVREGEPDTILKLPYDMSEYAPNTFTTGLYVGLLARWDFYWIVDALDMTIQRLTELYAEANQDGFIARKEGDGMPVLGEAFVRVKLA